jgi:hypothetical protein
MRKMKSMRRFGSIVIVGIVLSIILGLLMHTSYAQAAVIFTQFTASAGDTRVSVRWTTASEINTNGFYVVSSGSETGVYTRVSQFFPRQGTGISGSSYEFVHNGLTNGTPIFYKLEIINSDLSSIFTGAISAIPNPPTATPTLTITPTLTQTLTPTLTLTQTLTQTLTVTPTITITPSMSASPSTTITVTRTITLTPSKSATLVPSATIRVITAVPSRTLVRIMTATSTSLPTNSGGGYPNTTPDSTKVVETTTDDNSGGKYPGGETTGTIESGSTTPNFTQGTSNGEFVTQGTPVAFQTATPIVTSNGSSGEKSSSILGWVIGILLGLTLIGGAAWLYFRKNKNVEKSENDLFSDDPEN